MRALQLVYVAVSWLTANAFQIPRTHWNLQSKLDQTRVFLSQTDNGVPDQARFSDDLVESLDLLPLMEAVSLHAGTRRGRQSLLALVGADYDEPSQPLSFPGKRKENDMLPAKNRRLLENKDLSQSQRHSTSRVSRKYDSAIANSQQEALQEYEVVAQASLLLEQENYPPLYGSDSSPWDTETTAETDYDAWLELSSDDSTLEHILQAEKVIETFQRVKNWARDVQEKAPLLADIANGIPMESLNPIYDAISGTVKISRVRTLTDPSGKSSFNFQLNKDKFHVLKVLQNQVDEAAVKLTNCDSSKRSAKEKEFALLLDNLQDAEDEIRRSLFQLIIGNSAEINQSMNILARLDVIFAKAASGQSTGGLIPMVGNGGEIQVPQFVHPVLLGTKTKTMSRDVVPIDLKLSSKGPERALIISGPNGGGKTAAMKSFAIATIFCKLGLLIPYRGKNSEHPSCPPKVDFFDEIHVCLGDKQSLIGGESTMMAQLNACASVLENVASNAGPGHTSMVLFDELGGGTDPAAGGAIAQAILEKLLEVEGCRVIATTHVPRLKVLSYKSEQFGCATVLLEPPSRDNKDNGDYQLPAYHLMYDSIGDSYALGAASRSTPALPKDVLSRAANLLAAPSISSVNDDGATIALEDDPAYLQVLTESMERQTERAKAARTEADKYKRDILSCQKAMLAIASSYDRQFLLLEQKLEDMFQQLQASGADDIELVGNTLAELRLAKKQVKSQAEILKKRGLKLLPEWHEVRGGDTVVIASEDEMNGLSATVLSPAELPDGIVLKPDDVAVVLSMPYWDLESMDSDPFSFQPDTVIVKRTQVAIWDYDSVWEDDSFCDISVTSVKDSKRKLNDILSTIKTTSPSIQKAVSAPKISTFSSSRERKAAAKTNKIKKKQTKGR